MSRLYNKQKPEKDKAGTIDDAILGILSDELEVAVRNDEPERKDFDDFYNMMHCIRDNKPNEWESDIYLPEFSSRELSQIGTFVSQYFSSRDFVEPDVEHSDIQGVAEGKAGKKLLNTILNDKRNYYFEKIVRLMMFVYPGGYGIIKGGYNQIIERVQTGVKSETQYNTDELGNYLATTGEVYGLYPGQQLSKSTTETPVYGDRIKEDRPTFDVYPTQRVHMSKEYAYSLNDKEYIYFETEQTLADLERSQEFNNYVNLDKLEDTTEPQKRNTDTSNKNEDFSEFDRPVSPKYLIYERWGKWPVKVKEKDPVTNRPIEYTPGINKTGDWLENTELHECIITYAVKSKDSDSEKTLIRFQLSPHSKRPMVRFKCYVDSLMDSGFGDGEVNWELQTAINDNFNLGNYRTKLATTPAFKSKRFAGIPDYNRITPEKTIQLENMDDLQEFVIQDNIQGHAYQQHLITSRMDYAMATSPTTMGASPERREAATTSAIIDQRAKLREGLKNLTLEFIGFTEFYDMILNLVNDFMLPDTLQQILGDEVYNYNPSKDHRFKPVSQALETEESKQFKIKMWDQLLGRVVSIPNPKTPMAVNYILGQVLEIMGGDFKHFKKFMFSEDVEANALYQLVTGGKGGGAQTSGGMSGGGGPQNQIGLPQGQAEQRTRQG